MGALWEYNCRIVDAERCLPLPASPAAMTFSPGLKYTPFFQDVVAM